MSRIKIKRQKIKLKTCHFCGSKVETLEMIGGLTGVCCTNYSECGAIVSFNNEKCDSNSEKYTPEFWNRRV